MAETRSLVMAAIPSWETRRATLRVETTFTQASDL